MFLNPLKVVANVSWKHYKQHPKSNLQRVWKLLLIVAESEYLIYYFFTTIQNAEGSLFLTNPVLVIEDTEETLHIRAFFKSPIKFGFYIFGVS